MKMEIISPQEGGFLTEIKWNNKELLAAIEEKAAEYTGVVYSGDNWIKDAKSDRAELNKLKTAIETERKRIKKMCMDPYTAFEGQVKEVLKPLDEAIASIDRQLKEADELYKEEKAKEIQRIFEAQGFQDFVTLEMIWNEKWLNKTYSLQQIKSDMDGRMYSIGRDVLAISKLEEYKFEAKDYYKRTLDLSGALQEAQRLVDIQRRKEAAAAAEVERKRREEEERLKREELENLHAKEIARKAQEVKPEVSSSPAAAGSDAEPQEEIYQVDFRVWGTKEQMGLLAQFLKDNGIKYGKVV